VVRFQIARDEVAVPTPDRICGLEQACSYPCGEDEGYL